MRNCSPSRRIVVAATLASAQFLAPHAIVRAQAAADAHVRPTTSGARELLTEDMRRSPTVRTLVERLDRSDVVVYVQTRVFESKLTRGHLAFVGAAAGLRYVVVEIACGEAWPTQLATLGHELQHSTEIASARWIASTADMAAYYARVGMQVSFDDAHESFETLAAIDAGRRVARELNEDNTRIAAR